MKNKLLFLTKISLNKKIKTKWFLIANIIFMIIITGLINIDSVIKLFGGDFDETTNILVIDNANTFEEFKNNYEITKKYIDDYTKLEIINYQKDYDSAKKEILEDKNKIILILDSDEENYLKAKVVSNSSLDTLSKTIITNTLNSVRSRVVLNEYNITNEMYANINRPVILTEEVLDDNNKSDNIMISTLMQIITLPLFMLIIFLTQMIGAEVNEEKTTKSMEIIISNVSPKTHFISKIIAANSFVLIQGSLLLLYLGIGFLIRLVLGSGSILDSFHNEITDLTSNIPIETILSSLKIIIPLLLLMVILTFIAYSLLAGILASMTTNMEDYQQLQTPIMITSVIGYYLAMLSGIFKGSLFIRIMSYIPLISSMLAPTLYIMGEISLIDLLISITLLLGLIYVLIKYGIRIYKVGILNYSGTDLWKKMYKAIRRK